MHHGQIQNDDWPAWMTRVSGLANQNNKKGGWGQSFPESGLRAHASRTVAPFAGTRAIEELQAPIYVVSLEVSLPNNYGRYFCIIKTL